MLLNQVEDTEAELGRPLNRQDIEAMLLEFGHPLVVAARYRKTQQLIGPEIFPFWLTTLKWTLGIAAIVYVVLAAIHLLAGGDPGRVQSSSPSILMVAIFLFGMVTLVFSAFERFGKAGFLNDWKPSRLPPPDRRTRPRFAIASEIAVDVVFILWWQGLVHFQSFFPYPGHLSVALAPVWIAWRWPILAYAVFGIGANLVALARPGWSRTNTGLRAGRYLYGVAILAFVFQAGHWVEVSSPVIAPEVMEMIQINFDHGMRVGIGCTILGMLIQVGLDLRRAYRRHGGLGLAAQA